MKDKGQGKIVNEFLKAHGISQEALAGEMGLSRSVISEMVNGKRNIERVTRFLTEKFELDDDYFTRALSNIDNKRRHFISVAKAGLLTAEQGQDYEMQPVIAQFPKYDYTVEVRGDSMMPEYKSGDVVACLDVTRSTFIQWGRTFLLNTSQGVIIKKVFDAGDCVKCVSVNEEKYPAFEIPKSEIYSIGLVVSSYRIG